MKRRYKKYKTKKEKGFFLVQQNKEEKNSTLEKIFIKTGSQQTNTYAFF